jgi:hypothetical protein
MEEKFSKGMNSQIEMLKIKISINQIKMHWILL